MVACKHQNHVCCLHLYTAWQKYCKSERNSWKTDMSVVLKMFISNWNIKTCDRKNSCSTVLSWKEGFWHPPLPGVMQFISAGQLTASDSLSVTENTSQHGQETGRGRVKTDWGFWWCCCPLMTISMKETDGLAAIFNKSFYTLIWLRNRYYLWLQKHIKQLTQFKVEACSYFIWSFLIW